MDTMRIAMLQERQKQLRLRYATEGPKRSIVEELENIHAELQKLVEK